MLWTYYIPTLAATLYNEEEDVTDNYTVLLDAIDGEFSELTLFDETVDIGNSVLSPVDFFRCGRRIRPEHLPTRMLLTSTVGGVPRGKLRLPDFITTRAATIVSGGVKDIIEGIEPDIHQFVPVSLEWKGGEAVDGDFYFFAPCTRLFALDHVKTQPALHEFPDNPIFKNPRKDVPLAMLQNERQSPDFGPVFHKSIIKDKHVFGAGDIITGMILISDQVKQAFEAAGITGPIFYGPYGLSD